MINGPGSPGWQSIPAFITDKSTALFKACVHKRAILPGIERGALLQHTEAPDPWWSLIVHSASIVVTWCLLWFSPVLSTGLSPTHVENLRGRDQGCKSAVMSAC
ncbi:MAG: hypothetical protein WBL23_03050 [Salinisphaera sp.]|uniref:hypothetical protein n=1 Tax=Salinisphaera sp. TaxID=1914330 RepID=UPI003C7CD709